MQDDFREVTDRLERKYLELIETEPIRDGQLPVSMPSSGVYLYTENGKHLYVGRTRNIRSRYYQHLSEYDNQAGFAIKLAREATGYQSRHKGGKLSRHELLSDFVFKEAFDKARNSIRQMDFRWVEEADPMRQCLLEIYVSVVLKTPHNDFNTT